MSKMRTVDAAVAILEKEGAIEAFGLPGAAINGDYAVFVHILHPRGDVLWTDDHPPPSPPSSWGGAPVTYRRTMFAPRGGLFRFRPDSPDGAFRRRLRKNISAGMIVIARQGGACVGGPVAAIWRHDLCKR